MLDFDLFYMCSKCYIWFIFNKYDIALSYMLLDTEIYFLFYFSISIQLKQ